MEKEIEIMNAIVAESIRCGGDAGGAYDNGSAKLQNLLFEWLILKGYTGYHIEIKDVDYGEGFWGQAMQIVPNGEEYMDLF